MTLREPETDQAAEDVPKRTWLIDNQRFAEQRQSLQGSIPLIDLERLDDLLSEDDDSAAEFTLTGTRGPLGQLRLVLAVKAQMQVVCQRCLQGLPVALDVVVKLDVADEAVNLDHDDLTDDEADWIEAAREMDVAALVEDEIILSIPAMPKHDVCPQAGRGSVAARVEKAAVAHEALAPVKKASPFAALAALKTPAAKARKPKNK